MKRFLAMLLTLALVLSMMPATAMHVHAEEQEEVLETIPETEPAASEAVESMYEETSVPTEGMESVTECTDETVAPTEETEPVEETIPTEVTVSDEATNVVASGTCGENLTWTYSGGTLTVSGSGAMDDYTYYTQYDETDEPWDSYRKRIQKVVIEDGVTRIGGRAFFECVELTEVVIGNDVIEIGPGAFDRGNYVTKLTMGSSVEHVEESAFNGWVRLEELHINNLANWCEIDFEGDGANPRHRTFPLVYADDVVLDQNLTIPDGVTKIGSFAFYGFGLTDVQLPEGLTHIGNHAFSNNRFTSIEIPDSVISIDGGAFDACTKLISVEIPDGVSTIGDKTFAYCEDLCSVSLPDTIIEIGTEVFLRCGSLLAFEIPENVQSIGSSAFSYCENLRKIKFNSTAPIIAETAFTNVVADAYYPQNDESWTEDVLLDYGGNITWIPYDAQVETPESGTGGGVGDNAGEEEGEDSGEAGGPGDGTGSGESSGGETGGEGGAGGNGSEGTGESGSGTGTGSGAEGDSGDNGNDGDESGDTGGPNPGGTVENVVASGTCGEDLTWILDAEWVLTISGTGTMADYVDEEAPWGAYCADIEKVVIEDGVTSIGDYAFWKCESVTNITIPESVTSIDTHAFSYCSSLESIVIPESVTSIEAYVFSACSSLESVNIPDGVTSIGTHAFSGCSNLTSIVLPDSVTTLGMGAFYECYSLECVNIPDGVTSIGDYTFKDCGGLTTIDIPADVQEIGDYAFYGCCGLENIVIPNHVTSIGYNTFTCCESLSSITIPRNVKSIAVEAFSQCYALETITFVGNAPWIESTSFEDVAATAYYPANNETWTADIMQNYGGTITWTPYTPEDSDETVIASGICGENVTWRLNDEGLLTISGQGPMEDYHHNNGKYQPWYGMEYSAVKIEEGVTTVGNWAFCGASDLVSVTIPHGVTGIGYAAFKLCTSLTHISIPKGVRGIGTEAFRGCRSMVSIDIPETVTGIGEHAFENCHLLTDIYINDLAAWMNISFGRNGYESIPTEANSEPTKLYLNGELITNLVIPDGVTRIGDGMFKFCTSITSVTIPDSVTSIGISAFEGCTGLTDVVIPDSVTSIDEYAFYRCTGLTSVTLPKGLTKILRYGFRDCHSLTDITLPDSLTDIDIAAFENCRNLKSIRIPDSVTGINSDAFRNCSGLTSIQLSENLTGISSRMLAGCTNLTSITIPDNVTSIENDAFDGCSNLSDVYITDITSWLNISFRNKRSNPLSYGANLHVNGQLFEQLVIPEGISSIGNFAFVGCESITSVITHEGVTNIGNSAFAACTNLQSIDLPEKMSGIGSGAFSGCSSLTGDFTIPAGVPSIGNSTFCDCESLIGITIPDSVTSIGSGAFSGCSSLVSINIPESVISIGGSAFQNCSSLSDSIAIPEGVSSIGASMFYGCSNLTGVILPDSVTSIGQYAFFSCSSLSNIHLSDSITKISMRAFFGCNSLKSVDLPESLIVIDYGAFENCSSLMSISIPNGAASIGEFAFLDCTSLTQVTIPDSVTNIGNSAFQGCSSATSITIPNGMTSIGNNVFLNCSSLISAVVPDSVTTIGRGAFTGCSSLRSVIIPDSVITIESEAFKYCSSLKSISIPKKLDRIASNAFRGCTALTSIIIPDNVTYIGEEAFRYCSNLTSITVPGSVTTIGREAFANCSKLESIIIENGVTSMGVQTFLHCTNLTSIMIPESLVSFGVSTFAGIQKLGDVYYADTEEQWEMISGRPTSERVHFSCTEMQNHWKSESMAPTCTEVGYTREVCACGLIRNEVLSEATGHSYQSVVTAPTCTEKGYTTHTCHCNDSYVNAYVDALGHEMGQWETTKEAACMEAGSRRRDCARCDHFETEEITATGHSYETVITGPTCTEKGYTTHTCTACGDVYSDALVTELGHDMSAWTIVTPATCTDMGLQRRDCSRCEHFEEEDISATGHSYEATVTHPDCTEAGYTTHTCSACGTSYTDTPVAELGHNMSAWTIVIPATCTDMGLQRRDCARCDHFETEEITATGHSYEATVTPPDCTEAGYTTHTCSACGDTYTDAPVAELGHDMSAWTIVTPANCTDKGLQRRDCSRCEHFEEEDISATGHSYEATVTPPDCMEAGYTTHICSACGDTYTDAPVAELGHDMSAWTIVTPATCTDMGLQRRDCSRCEHFEEEDVSATGHTEVIDAAVAPTCTETGLTEGKHCSVCSEILLKQESISATGHNYEAVVTPPACEEEGYTTHTCSVCGDTYKDTPVDALVHVEVVDEAVLPTCTETGLTEGKHCDRCGDVLIPQEVIPATGHDFVLQDEEHHCTVCHKKVYVQILHNSVRLDLTTLTTMQLEIKVPEYLAETVEWSVEGAAGILQVDGNGLVTAMEAGSAYVVATVTEGDLRVSSRCRVDVTETVQLTDIQLNTNKVDLELYKDTFATFEILLDLPQNHPVDTLMISDSATNAVAGLVHKSNIIDSVQFKTISDLFELQLLDDRTVQIVPTQKAMDSGKTVKSSYSDTVIVTVNGKIYESEKLTLSVKKTLPKVKAKIGTFNSFYEGQSQEIVITGGEITGIRANENKNTGKTVAIPAWLTLENGYLKLNGETPKSSDKAYLWVDVEGWRVPAELTLSVKHAYKAPTLTLSTKSVTLNTLSGDEKIISVTSNFADYVPTDLEITGTAGDALTIEKQGNGFVVSTNEQTAPNKSYKVTVKTANPKIKAVTLTVKTVGKDPTMNALKVKGTMDVNFPGNKATVGVTLKDYADVFVPTLTIKDSKGNDATNQFNSNWNGTEFEVTPNGAVKGTYTATVSVTIDMGEARGNINLEKTAKLTVKETLPKVKLSSTKVTLNKKLGNSTIIDITSATKGYELDHSRVEITAPEQIKAEYAEGKLKVSLNESAAYGKTYKVSVRAYAGASAVTLNVAVPAENKSNVTASIKASGFIDVIRESSAITVTPTFTNAYASDMESMELKIYKRNGKVWDDVTVDAPIDVELTEGKYIVTAKDGLLHTDKYQAELVAVVGGKEIVSKRINLSIKMGSTKLTIKSSDTTLFAKDRNDRALVWFEAADLTLNDVKKIEIKDAKYKDAFQIIDYQDGTFAIGFKDGKLHKEIEKLIAKKTSAAITLNLNVFIEGNESTKINTTQKVKLTIVK